MMRSVLRCGRAHQPNGRRPCSDNSRVGGLRRQELIQVAGDRGETTSGPKLTSVPTLSSLGRPGSPPPELLTFEGTRIVEFCKWHFGAATLPKSANGMAL